MLIAQKFGINQIDSMKKHYTKLFLLICLVFLFDFDTLVGNEIISGFGNYLKASKKNSARSNNRTLTYYLYISDFAQSFIEIPTAPACGDSSTLDSRYLAGRAAIYNEDNVKAGTCSASFLCMQNQDGVYTDISNFISVNNGLVVSWFTPTTLINLKLDSIINSMVTECIVVASTKIGVNPFYGETFKPDLCPKSRLNFRRTWQVA